MPEYDIPQTPCSQCVERDPWTLVLQLGDCCALSTSLCHCHLVDISALKILPLCQFVLQVIRLVAAVGLREFKERPI